VRAHSLGAVRETRTAGRSPAGGAGPSTGHPDGASEAPRWGGEAVAWALTPPLLLLLVLPFLRPNAEFRSSLLLLHLLAKAFVAP